MTHRPHLPRSLSSQITLRFFALILLTATTVGVPSVLLIRNQFDRQAWAQVEQGIQAAEALYEARMVELEGLATLIAQRPTLQQLFRGRDWAALQSYLDTLREGSGVDLIALCDTQGKSEATSAAVPLQGICSYDNSSNFHLAPADAAPRAWLVAAQPGPWQAGADGPRVIVGLALNDRLAADMRAQTGLEHTITLDGKPLATSFSPPPPASDPTAPPPSRTFRVGERRYFAAFLPLDGSGLVAEMALDVTDIAATQRNLMAVLIAGIGAILLAASLFGALPARRISQPLSHLARAADAMSQGDLSTPITIETDIREVAHVAQALESTRADLQNSVADLRREKYWGDHLLASIVEGIVTLDRRGHVTFFSEGAERITGLNRDQVLGASCDHLFKPLETEEPFSRLIPAPGQRQKIPVEFRDGRPAILAVSGARLVPPEGHDARVALVFRDISEEETMHRLMGHFLANVAHEFRTPLSALAASVELLMDQAPDLSPEELGELLTSLHLGVLGLQTLIDNLLASSSIEAGRFRVHFRPTAFNEILAEAISTMQPLLDKHGQSLIVQIPPSIPTLQADPRRLSQVLINLLSNASKYGPDDAEIEVAASLENSWLRVTVSDSGPGVPVDQRQDLFRRFMSPGRGTSHAEVGAGLGLSVVRAVVQAHGGGVGIDDRPRGGARFWFTLPIERDS